MIIFYYNSTMSYHKLSNDMSYHKLVGECKMHSQLMKCLELIRPSPRGRLGPWPPGGNIGQTHNCRHPLRCSKLKHLVNHCSNTPAPCALVVISIGVRWHPDRQCGWFGCLVVGGYFVSRSHTQNKHTDVSVWQPGALADIDSPVVLAIRSRVV